MLKVDYFNPVVDDWTEEAQAKELEERKNCHLCLYTITPAMTGVYSIAEVVDDSNKRSAKTILCLLEKEFPYFAPNKMGLSFTSAQWKSLQAVANMVKGNGGEVFYNLEDTAEWINTFSEK